MNNNNINLWIIIFPAFTTGLFTLLAVFFTNRHNLKCLRYSEVNTNTRKAYQKVFALAFKISRANTMDFLMIKPYGAREDIAQDLNAALSYAAYCHEKEIYEFMGQVYRFCRDSSGMNLPDMALATTVLTICEGKLKEI